MSSRANNGRGYLVQLDDNWSVFLDEGEKSMRNEFLSLYDKRDGASKDFILLAEDDSTYFGYVLNVDDEYQRTALDKDYWSRTLPAPSPALTREEAGNVCRYLTLSMYGDQTSEKERTAFYRWLDVQFQQWFKHEFSEPVGGEG